MVSGAAALLGHVGRGPSPTCVPPQLPADRRAVPAPSPGDLRTRQPLSLPWVDLKPFTSSEMNMTGHTTLLSSWHCTCCWNPRGLSSQ
jgi:hypothetical protein